MASKLTFLPVLSGTVTAPLQIVPAFVSRNAMKRSRRVPSSFQSFQGSGILTAPASISRTTMKRRYLRQRPWPGRFDSWDKRGGAAGAFQSGSLPLCPLSEPPPPPVVPGRRNESPPVPAGDRGAATAPSRTPPPLRTPPEPPRPPTPPAPSPDLHLPSNVSRSGAAMVRELVMSE